MEQQNITYFTQEMDHGQSNGNSQDQYSGQVEFHSNSNPGGYQLANERGYHGGNSGRRTFASRQQHIVVQQNPISLPQKIISSGAPGQTVHLQLVPQGARPVTSQQQHIIISAQPIKSSSSPNSESDAFMEYIVDPPPQQPGCSSNIQTLPQYRIPGVDTKYTLKSRILTGIDKTAEKAEKEALKRAKQAEAARQRYHRLTPDEKKALNLKRTLAQKRKKQREKEMAQLEAILRASGDIYDDPEVLEHLREKRMRAKWAEAARNRYQRSKMSEEERRMHNMKRRMKQQAAVAKVEDADKEGSMDEEAQRRVKEVNAKKAETARLRYHRMSTEEKKLYNQRRTEAFRRRRMEEEALLAMPIGRINGEALDRAQQIVIRNAKRAEAARLRYQRMTPEQRRAYNQKRYTPKRKRQLMEIVMTDEGDELHAKTEGEEEYDALSSLERDVLRRTQQAQQTLLRKRVQQDQTMAGGNVVVQSASGGPTHIVQSISGSPRHQQQIIMQQPGTSQQTTEGLPTQQIQYITTTGPVGGKRILMSGSQTPQQVTYVTTTPQHQRA